MAAQSTHARGAPALAYLISQYPAVSHTFILREIEELERLGMDIRTASIKPPTAGNGGLAEAEARAAERTFYVRTRSLWRVLGDHAACLARRPGGYARGALFALRLAGPDLKAAALHMAYLAEAVVVGEWMRRNGLRHIHVHLANAACTAALLAREIYGIPYSATVHGPDEFYDTSYYHLREKVEGAGFLCCISRFCRSQLMKASSPEHWGKMEVCPLGVDPEAFRPRPEVSGGEFRILCVGRLAPAKGQAILLAAIGQLIQRGRRVHADLVGDGPDREGLRKIAERLRITPSVTFHGAVNQAGVAALLARADAFALPSFAEGVPVSLMEAMAMEIPCISTTVAGIPELIASGEEGILVPPSDAEALAAAIEALMDSPDLRLRLGQAGRRKVIRSYNLRVNVGRLAEIFGRRLGFETPAARAAGQA